MNENKGGEKLAFVFSGGNSLGAIEVGMLKALVEQGILPDFVVGSSVGSLNAAFFAFHPDLPGIRELSRIWLGIQSKDVFPPSIKAILLSLFGLRSNLVKPDGLKKILKTSFPETDLGGSVIPAYLITADLLTGVEVTFSSGPLQEILLASASIPLVFPPVRIGSHILVDGGVVNNAGISTAVSKGATKIVVLPAGFNCSRRNPPSNLIDTALTSFSYLMHQKLITDLESFASKVDLKLVPPLCPISTSSYDFSHSAELMKRGYKQAKDWLARGGFEGKIPMKIMRFHEH